ncbi:AAA family ATPase [Thiomicrospira cyclica]|uniref:ATPase associated with various cellular activities AAA_3 n=1 Tax=Thiomicrospira cyclica (strain DSM 14477 / JCM 11371 / ALM1) TaxID=717773 RepID=F6DBM8_THICA|nr:MoxR family ATPase [Thiomicrospira cyclica]AEG32430.1 ATPase associated with various cellular activities AAA_3 [Thiomicrospira cyclica ALM1]
MSTNLLEQFQQLQQQLNAKIIGQPQLIERLLITLLAKGHLLVEGPPGLAKTKAVKTLADMIEGEFHRIQFTPDLLPADITGTDIYRAETHQFEFQPGPIFHNIILADEINRAPAKVQSALLEAMGEGQVSVGQQSFAMKQLFMVMATQNPIEQEGTYPLPEAQLDRFLMQVKIDYPQRESERQILDLVEDEARHGGNSTDVIELGETAIFEARQVILGLHMAESVKDYIVELVMATRQPHKYSAELAKKISYGVSPRATIALSACARAQAWLHGQDFVSPQNVQAVIHDVFRHRLLLSYDAEADGISVEQCIDEILEWVTVV